MGEFLVGKHTKEDKEKIRIYKAVAKRAQNENELLEMEFLSNRDVLAAFEAIVSEGQELVPEEQELVPEENVPETAGAPEETPGSDGQAGGEPETAPVAETEGVTEDADIS